MIQVSGLGKPKFLMGSFFLLLVGCSGTPSSNTCDGNSLGGATTSNPCTGSGGVTSGSTTTTGGLSNPGGASSQTGGSQSTGGQDATGGSLGTGGAATGGGAGTGGTACTAGTCQTVACNPGFADCDGNGVNGCETDITSAANCGSCGKICSPAHATALCWDGQCMLNGCDPNYANCDGDVANGCEADMTAGILCDAPPVAMGSASPLNVQEGCANAESGRVTFSHVASYELASSHSIVDYQWIFRNVHLDPLAISSMFDAYDWNAIPNNGFNGDAFHTSSRTVTPVYAYYSAGVYHPVLRVVDNHNPPMSDTYVVNSISVAAMPLAAPTVVAGGPYVVAVGQDLMLKGTATDATYVCRSVGLSASWDLNRDGVSDFKSVVAQAYGASLTGTITWAAINALNLPHNTPNIITLAVTAYDGASPVKLATVMDTLTINDNVSGGN